MKKITLLLITAVILMIAACTQRASKVNPDIIKDMSDKMTYFKDSKGICYATLASRHPIDTDQNGFTITYVPCTPAVERAITGSGNEPDNLNPPPPPPAPSGPQG